MKLNSSAWKTMAVFTVIEELNLLPYYFHMRFQILIGSKDVANYQFPLPWVLQGPAEVEVTVQVEVAVVVIVAVAVIVSVLVMVSVWVRVTVVVAVHQEPVVVDGLQSHLQELTLLVIIAGLISMNNR